MLASLTGAGLSAAAGFNAYIPFLLVALISRFTDFINLPANFQWIESPWAIGIASVLLISEFVLDKIPVVDSINDTVGTVIRPMTGGLIFAATAAAEEIETSSSFFQNNPWIGILLGAVTAGVVHTGKAVSRPVINVGTAGSGAMVASSAEDGAAVALSITAIFAPILVILALIALVAVGIWLFRKVRAYRARKAARYQPTQVIDVEPERYPAETERHSLE